MFVLARVPAMPNSKTTCTCFSSYENVLLMIKRKTGKVMLYACVKGIHLSKHSETR